MFIYVHSVAELHFFGAVLPFWLVFTQTFSAFLPLIFLYRERKINLIGLNIICPFTTKKQKVYYEKI